MSLWHQVSSPEGRRKVGKRKKKRKEKGRKVVLPWTHMLARTTSSQLIAAGYSCGHSKCKEQNGGETSLSCVNVRSSLEKKKLTGSASLREHAYWHF